MGARIVMQGLVYEYISLLGLQPGDIPMPPFGS